MPLKHRPQHRRQQLPLLIGDPFYYFQLISSSNSGVIQIDEKKCILYVNKQMEKWLNYSNSEILHKDIFTFLKPKSKTQIQKKWMQRKQGVSEQYEVRFIKKDGTPFDALITANPILSPEGIFQGALALVTDITQIKKSEERLSFLSHASQTLAQSLDYHHTLQQITELVVPRLADWCLIDIVNDQGQLVTVGIAHRNPKQVKWAKQYRKDNPIDLKSDQVLARILRTGKAEIYPHITDEVLTVTTKNKEHRKLIKKLGFCSVMIVPLVGHKRVLGTITLAATQESNTHYDQKDLQFCEELAARASLAIQNARLYEEAKKEIEVRRKTEDQLVRTQRQFRLLIDSSIMGISIGDFYGRILQGNDAFLELIGYSREDLEQGRIHWREITPPEYKEIDDISIAEMCLYGECTPYEKEYITKNQHRIPVLVGKAMLDETQGKEKFLAFTLDNSARKQIEQRKDEFISIASHELKSPLTSLKGLTQILQKKYQHSNDPTLVNYLSKMDYQIKQLQHLVTSLLDVSVMKSGKVEYQLETIEIDQLLSEAIENTQLTSDDHHIVLLSQSKKHVSADKHRLYQVFVNLLTNAIKYSPQSNKVEVHVEGKKNQVIISITDFGIGIPLEHQHRVFERFYRVNNKGKHVVGMGLGLYISAEIIKRHHGQITLESTKGKGTTFRITLPTVD